MTEEELSAIVNEDNVEVIEHTAELGMMTDETGIQTEQEKHSLKVSYQKKQDHRNKSKIK